ncbi:MAG TPA: BON domain-containing protein [Acidobacteriota bacterium]|nr:BON domain-containing protein [Acidobacteriota bacterium]
MHKAIRLIASLLFASVAIAAEQGEYDEIAKKVEQKINSDGKIHIEHLKVLHNNDTIHLEGVAQQFGSKYLAGKIADDQKGVDKVDNQIAVTAAQVSDDEIRTDLIAAIRKHMRPEPFDSISVKCVGGFVTLYGSVRDLTLIEKAMNEAVWVRGVRGIENKIEATPVSRNDDRLRIEILNRLQAKFPRYFVGRPTIVILVSNGRVTLQGNVSTEVEKVQMRNTIRSVVGVLSVDNQLRTD